MLSKEFSPQMIQHWAHELLIRTMPPERIRRHDDERLYQPRIHSRWIRELYQISQETGLPMTALVDWAIGQFVENHSSSRESGVEEQYATDLSSPCRRD